MLEKILLWSLLRFCKLHPQSELVCNEPVCKRSNMLQHWTHHPCIRGQEFIHLYSLVVSTPQTNMSRSGSILSFLGHQKNIIVKQGFQQGRSKKARGRHLSVQVQGLMLQNWPWSWKLCSTSQMKKHLVRIQDIRGLAVLIFIPECTQSPWWTHCFGEHEVCQGLNSA